MSTGTAIEIPRRKIYGVSGGCMPDYDNIITLASENDAGTYLPYPTENKGDAADIRYGYAWGTAWTAPANGVITSLFNTGDLSNHFIIGMRIHQSSTSTTYHYFRHGLIAAHDRGCDKSRPVSFPVAKGNVISFRICNVGGSQNWGVDWTADNYTQGTRYSLKSAKFRIRSVVFIPYI